MSSRRTTLSKRARTMAGATALSLGGFAIGGFGGLRPAFAYGSGMSSRTFALPCDITVSNDTDLQNAVANSRDDSVICISQSITLSAELTFDDTTVTLIGDDSTVTLTAPANDRHIYAKSANVGDDTITLMDLTLTGGNPASNGGSIYSLRMALDLSDSILSSNTSANFGGAIYAKGNAGLSATTTHFHGNHAVKGGAIGVDGTGPVNFQGGSFTRNSGLSSGGSVYVKTGSGLTTNGTTFYDDTAGGRGGAIYFLAAAPISITGGTFTRVSAAAVGGVIATGAQATGLATTNTTFVDDSSTGGNGGAIYFGGTGPVTLTGGTFTRTRAAGNGGAIYVRAGSGLTTNGTTFYDNTSTGGSGGAIYFGGSGQVNLNGGTFTRTTAVGVGGAIYAGASSTGLTTNGTTFYDNTSTGGSGGAIYFGGTGEVTLNDGTFARGSVPGNGGAVRVGATATGLTSTGTDFYDNRSTGSSAGAIYFGGAGQVSLSGGTLARNTAVGNAGALGADDSMTSLTLDDMTFTANVAAGGSGGAIFLSGSGDATITATGFARNRSNGPGGALYSGTGSENLSITGSTFTDDTSAAPGGAIFFAGNGDVTLTGVDFTGNEAGGPGGALHAASSVDNLTATNTTFTDTASSGPAGAIFFGGSADITLTGSRFERTSSANVGGAIYAGTSVDNFSVTGTTFTDTTSGGTGGAINFTGTGGLHLDSSNFLRGTATVGGAIYVGGSVTNTNSTSTNFSGNTALSSPGGAINSSGGPITVTRGSFISNSAPASVGGAISADDTVTVSEATFASNSAQFVGAAVTTSGAVEMTNSTVFDNSSGGSSLRGVAGVTLRFVTAVDDSVAGGDVVYSAGPISIVGSVIAPYLGNACSGPADDSSLNSFVTDSSCGSGDDTVTVTTRSLLGVDDTLVTDDSTGMQVLIPDDTSILIGAAPFNLVPGVLVDQLGAVRGVRGSATTTVGAVQVLPVLFTTQPAGATVPVGSSASFSVAADPGVGTSPVTFQWQSSADNGATWSNISGATGSTLTLSNVTTSQTGLLVRAVASDLRPAAGNSASALLTVTAPPAPLTPGAPRNPEATGGDNAAEVTWTAPSSSGTFPITTYQVTNDIDDSTCLLSIGPDTPLACELTGLTNDTAYRFRVRALTGAGWGPWSDWTTPVTPRKPSIVITGTRDGRLARVSGITTGIEAGEVKTRVRLQGQRKYQTGVPRQVTAEDTFTWQRRTSKKVYIYFTADGIRSNRIIIPTRR